MTKTASYFLTTAPFSHVLRVGRSVRPLRVRAIRTVLHRSAQLLCIACLASCASSSFQTAQTLLQQGRTEEGLIAMKAVVDAEPENMQASTQYFSRVRSFANAALSNGQVLRQQGKFEEAKAVYEHLLRVDASNTAAQNALGGLPREVRETRLVIAAQEALKHGDVDQAMATVHQVLAENPDHYAANLLQQDIEEVMSLDAGHRMMGELSLKLPKGEPISLEFREANLKMVIDALGRASGVNFVLDKDVRADLRVTISVRNASLEEAVKVVLQSNQLEYKVFNANSVLVYPSVAEKLKIYQDLVVKAFYLQNADVKQVQANVKALLKSRDTVIDEKLNLFIMRDTPDAIAAAEKIVAMQDLKEPEVMLEVEIVEISRSKLTNLGIQWPSAVTLTPLASSSGTGLTLSDVNQISNGTIGVSSLATTLNLNKTVTDGDVLANPRIRVRNRETAKIMIGDKLPVITSNVTSNGIVSPSVSYLDVGLKLEVQPDIRLKSSIGIKVDLEVSSILKTFLLAGGTQTYQIGTRNASTRLNLRDGETQILGGLINEQEGTSANRIPGIGDLPVLNRIFGSQSDSKDRTELVLSITPHLIRNLVLPSANQTQFWSGTESSLRMQGLGESLNQNSAKITASVKSEVSNNSAQKSVLLPQDSAKNVVFSWKTLASGKDGVQEIQLYAKADGSMRSLPLQLGFDPQACQILSVEEGAYFKRDGGNSTFSNSIDAQKGRIFVTTTRNDVQGASAGEFAVLNIKARMLGASPIDLRVLSAEPVIASGERTMVTVPPPWTLPAVAAAQ